MQPNPVLRVGEISTYVYVLLWKQDGDTKNHFPTRELEKYTQKSVAHN
jgi:hypothetical protein